MSRCKWVCASFMQGHYGEAFKRADMLRVLDEEFNMQLKKEGKELEQMNYQKLTDKVQTYVRLNSKGMIHTDIGKLNMNMDEDLMKEEETIGDEKEKWKQKKIGMSIWVGYVGSKGKREKAAKE